MYKLSITENSYPQNYSLKSDTLKVLLLKLLRFNAQARTKKKNKNGEKCYPFQSVTSQDKQVGLIQLWLAPFLAL